jgi:general secretion pathway protein K
MTARAERGAAVVMAMLVVAVTAMLISGAFWRQSVLARQAENELSYAQAKWLLRGAVEWAGVVLREDARVTRVDHLGEPWAVQLAETRLNQDDEHDPVYISGIIRDEQARFNLRNLAGPQGIVNARELATLRRLLALVGASEGAAGPIAARVLASLPGASGREQSAIGVTSIDDLLGLSGVGPATVERLRPFVTVLPQPTAINANTAPAVVLAARFENLSLSDAQRLAASRDRSYFKDRADVLNRLGELRLDASELEIAVATRFFSVDGTVSYRRARLRTQALLRREANRVETLWMKEAT